MSRAHNAKLSDDDIRAIRVLHDWKMAEQRRLDSIASYRALAEKFGVSHKQVFKVINFITYKDVR